MRVDYDWSDSAGDSYNIRAEVHPLDHNRIQIVSVTTGEGVEVDMDDFDAEEQKDILWLAKQGAESLDKDEEVEDDDDELESGEDDADY